MTPKQYLWAIGTNPAYFVQYQVKSAAIFRVKEHILIGWKPKFIEYPTMIVFPEIKDKTRNYTIKQWTAWGWKSTRRAQLHNTLTLMCWISSANSTPHTSTLTHSSKQYANLNLEPGYFHQAFHIKDFQTQLLARSFGRYKSTIHYSTGCSWQHSQDSHFWH